MQVKRRLQPRTRGSHNVVIEDEVWNALLDYAVDHNMHPGQIIEAALRKHLSMKPGDFG